jgi:hypothetical protein
VSAAIDPKVALAVKKCAKGCAVQIVGPGNCREVLAKSLKGFLAATVGAEIEARGNFRTIALTDCWKGGEKRPPENCEDRAEARTQREE